MSFPEDLISMAIVDDKVVVIEFVKGEGNREVVIYTVYNPYGVSRHVLAFEELEAAAALYRSEVEPADFNETLCL